jgi:hypothetical protein
VQREGSQAVVEGIEVLCHPGAEETCESMHISGPELVPFARAGKRGIYFIYTESLTSSKKR